MEVRSARLWCKLAAAYYLLCGLSAIVWPSSWYFLAGLPAMSSPVPMALVGTLMLSLSFGAWRSSRAQPFSQAHEVVLVLLVATLLDFLLVGISASLGLLSAYGSVGFLALDLGWIMVFLGICKTSKLN